MRHAIYLTPPRGAALERAAAVWLGRSAFGDPADAGAAPAAARADVPARYGFHATLKAPFTLAPAVAPDDLAAAFDAFAAATAPVEAQLAVAALGDFLALRSADEAPLAALAERAVRAFEPYRAPVSEADRVRRDADALDPRGRELLETWGYPYVMERFRFHITLTGPLAPADHPAVAAAAEAHFAGVLAAPQRLVPALFVEPAAGAPFVIARVGA